MTLLYSSSEINDYLLCLDSNDVLASNTYAYRCKNELLLILCILLASSTTKVLLWEYELYIYELCQAIHFRGKDLLAYMHSSNGYS